MHLLTEYVQPLTYWLHEHTRWALLITFLMSFAESLAVIGSLVPGSVTMTAIGILAGSGIMRIDLTFMAATLGAIAGDSASYALGYTLSDRIVNIWPFSRYPKWLNYGKDYFAKHGSKSVLIGRFFGPLRSIIPVIAGMMHMPSLRFFLANFISAIGWAFLYVMPGVLIGAASTELSAESASRLIGIILLLLVTLWLASQLIKWLFAHVHHWLRVKLHTLWEWSGQHPHLHRLYHIFMPKDETNRYTTLVLMLFFLICLVLSLIVCLLVIRNYGITVMNNPVFFFLQSFQTYSINAFFIIISFMISPVALMSVIGVIALSALHSKDWRLLAYWGSLVVCCCILNLFLNLTVRLPNITHPLHHTSSLTFPANQLMIATALFSFLLMYAYKYYTTAWLLILQLVFLPTLLLAGLAIIYLGDNWFTSVIAAYLMGCTLSAGHWLAYRRKTNTLKVQKLHSTTPFFLCLFLLLTTGLEYSLHFKQELRENYPESQQYALSHDAWWHQHQLLMPMYTTNRLGKRIGLFNLQYAGNLDTFEQALTTYGWQKQPNSLFPLLLMRVTGQEINRALLSMTPLYLNKSARLTMTYEQKQTSGLYILRLWQSNYHLFNESQPIWFGSIVYIHSGTMNHPQPILQSTAPFTPVLRALSRFPYTSVTLPEKLLDLTPNEALPELLIVKEPQASAPTIRQPN